MGLSTRLRLLYENGPAPIRNLGGITAGNFPPRIRYGRSFAQMARAAKLASTAGVTEIQALQLHELQRIWNIAAERVPYYKRLIAAGNAPRHIRRIEDLLSIPLLRKDDVRSLGDLLCDPTHAPNAYRVVTTSGTGGQPLGLRVTYAASAREWALMLDSWSRVGFTSRSRRAVLRGARIRGRENGARSERDPLNRALVLSGFDLSTDDLDRYAVAIRQYRAEFLHAYPSTAWILARHLASMGGARDLGLKGVLLGSETVYPDQRAFIEQSFGCRVYTWYGHTEKCAFASECETEFAYHPNSLYGYIELVDAFGVPVIEAGKRGQIVATGFLNEATLLIRYVTDDEAEWTDQPCSCGRPGWRLVNVTGHRTQEYLVSATGSLIPMTTLHGMHAQSFTAVSEFQFYQDTPGLVEYRYVPAQGWSDDSAAKIHEELLRRFRGLADVRMVQVHAIARTESGKRRFVDQRLSGYGEGGLHLDHGGRE